jgi:beta-glucosidase
VLGDSMSTAREGADRDTLDLAGSQLALLTAVAASVRSANSRISTNGVDSHKLVVVLLPGRPATFGHLNQVISPGHGVDAVVVAWRPGECGAKSIVDVLTGAVNPSGKLNQAWPRSVGAIGGSSSPWLARRPGGFMHVRDDTKHDPTCDATGHCFSHYVDQSASPLWPFGHGLSYTVYRYSDVSAAVVSAQALNPTSSATFIDAPPPPPCGPQTTVMMVNVTVANVGRNDGTEIVQAYVKTNMALLASKKKT